jgi:hypothetical protein
MSEISLGPDLVLRCERMTGTNIEHLGIRYPSYHYDLLLRDEPVMAGYGHVDDPLDFWFCYECEDTLSEDLFAEIAPYLPRFIELAQKFRRDHP